MSFLKIIADLHTHTVASGHAYSTIEEICRWAKKRHLKAVAITDHGPSMLGGASLYHFSNLRCLPEKLFGVRILKGAEVNVLTENGDLDLPDNVLKSLEVVIVSFHDKIGLLSGSPEKNTEIAIKALSNPYVHIFGHPENPFFPVDIKKVVQAAKELGKIIEINNASLTVARKGSLEAVRELIAELKAQKVATVLSSDAHIASRVGDFEEALKLLKELKFPQELVLNASLARLNKKFGIK